MKITKYVSMALTGLLTSVTIIGSIGTYTSNIYAATGDVEINSTNFPDYSFRDFVSKNIDTNGDGYLGKDEIKRCVAIGGIVGIDDYYERVLSGEDIDSFRFLPSTVRSLKGIEFFTFLEGLDCTSTAIKTLDISKNTRLRGLRCDETELTTLDLSNNTELEELYCIDTSLKELDLSKNKKLEVLECYRSNLTTLNLKNNSALKELSCGSNNLLELNVDNCTNLTRLNCGSNKLTSINVRNNKLLNFFQCFSNNLSNLDLSKNEALRYLHCGRNNLTSLDLTYNTALTECHDEEQYREVSSVNGEISLLDLDSNIDPNRIVYLSNAKLEGNKFVDIVGDEITYRYEEDSLGYYGGSLPVTLKIVSDIKPTEVSSITLNKKNMVLDKGSNGRLSVTIKPDNATYKTVTWSSSNTNVATVDNTGNVTAVNHGTAKITAKTSNGKTATCEVRVNFADVASTSQYYYKPVYWAADNKITTGSNGLFAPHNSCTREHAITFLWRMAGSPQPKSMVSKFKDVQNINSYSYKAIMWGTENGIITGAGGVFAPNNTCTREQIVTMLWRLAGKPVPKSASSKFKDVQNKNSYSYNAILWASEKGITTGANGEFKPGKTCTRAEIVTFIYRYKNTVK